MPWQETRPMDQRDRFIQDERLALYSMTELCARYGVSRKTGYKWLARFDEEGRRGLQDRSRAPHHCPHRIGKDVARVLVAARRAHDERQPSSAQPFTISDRLMEGPRPAAACSAG